ncbi:MAG TPA: arginine--tRNA ligase [Candidatus Cryptobacteroides merdipullorum]|uniref:Arginine--tRNA ligase n=1 Tax=Candidatus Cryptobacteroides merdipullorum TaxID=2840771 RepID=A0A9D1GLV3_9BACT|nr:arginine--tRNA ligase [Candidatus Cryptobacteroides merdipullorum]
MTAEQLIAAKASEAVKAIYGADIATAALQVQPTRKEFEGDYTLVVFPLLKISRQAPDATGNAIGEWLLANCAEISAFNSVKGFLNLSLSGVYWQEQLAAVSSDAGYGQLPPTGRRIMVEFSSPNTNKPLHLGHVRNNLLGASVSDLLKAAGNEVIKVTLVNDRGVHICKSMYAWQQRFDGATPESTGKKGDHLVGDCYVEYAKMEKEDPSVIDKVHEMLVKWEEGDPEVRALWEKMNSWVFAGFDQTYKALGISFDKTYYEHDTYLLGKELVQRGLDKGVFQRDPDGSVWCDLTADGLDRKLLLRSDGTSVYITQDLGTAEKRFEEYSLDSHIYVVGDEQNYHFQVLKLILKKLGFDWADQIYHLSYGMVELPEGKMKSREGTVVDADDLIEKMYEEAKATSDESGKLAELPEEEKDRLYHAIGLGALKYFILKVDPKKKMLFNPKESIDFNGNTGPFIQYTHARIMSILRKADEQGISAALEDGVSLSPKEVRLVKLISAYPQKVAEAADALSPALIANYCYELSKEFNQYYHDTTILREPDRKLLEMRLVLISTLASVLRKAMKILGIELPDRM